MVLSRAANREAFDHVMDNVLDRGDDSPLKGALIADNVKTIVELISMTYGHIDTLTYREPDSDVDLPMFKGDKSLLASFHNYYVFRSEQGDPILDDDWLELTQEDFTEFRMSVSQVFHRSNVNVPPGQEGHNGGPRFVMSSVENFKRGIKRDPTLFPTLKDESHNDSWHRGVVNQARAQDVHEVMDPEYVPANPEAKALFDAKQTYMYAVFEKIVQTDRGRAIVRQFESTFDAQKVYAALVMHHLQSTMAQMDASELMGYLATARFGTGAWQQNAQAFVDNWLDKVRLYERIADEPFSDKMKKIMLENAVSGVSELRQVKNNADLDTVRTGKPLTFDQYWVTLLSACTAYDKTAQLAMTKPKRNVMVHEWSLDDVGQQPSDEPEEFSFGIDATVTELQAYAADRQRFAPRGGGAPPSGGFAQRTRMPRERWMQLTDDARKTWDRLADRDKAIILGLLNNGGDSVDNRDSATGLQPAFRRKVNFHGLHPDDEGGVQGSDGTRLEEFHDASDGEVNQATASNTLVNAARSSSANLAPHDIRRLLSQTSQANSARSVNTVTVYRVSNRNVSQTMDSLLDRGANGGVAGCDVRVISKGMPHRRVNIQGIDNHQMTGLELGTVGGVVRTQRGLVIAVFHQYALYGKGPTIHASGQLEHYKNVVDDKSVHVGGKQCVTTLDGYVMPLYVQQGLARLPIRPFTDDEWDSLPHVLMTHDLDWDPSVLDYAHDRDDWFDDVSDGLDTTSPQPMFDAFGNLRMATIDVQHAYISARLLDDPSQWEQMFGDDRIENAVDQAVYYDVYNGIVEQADVLEPIDERTLILPIEPRTLQRQDPDLGRLRPYFGWISTDLVKQTLSHTTQYGRLPAGTHLKQVYKSANPALNVPRRSEAVACDVVYSDTPAIDDGAKSAVLFVGHDTYVTDIYGIKSDNQFIRALQDNMRERGAPDRLLSDRAQVNISKNVENVLRTFCIGSWQSEPHQQQQNPAERRFQTIKTTTNRILDRTGAPPSTWLLCLQYVCFLLNHTYNSTLGTVPLLALTGSTPDVSVLLRFYFWQKVLYKKHTYGFPSTSPEGLGHIVGISEHVGPALCWKILTADTQQVIFRSQVRPYTDEDPNLRAGQTDGESDRPTDPDSIVQSRGNPVTVADVSDASIGLSDAVPPPAPLVEVSDLVGRTFLTDTDDNGEKLRARIARLVDDFDAAVDRTPERIKFVCQVGDSEAEEVFTYAQVMDYLNRDSDAPVWKYKRIASHQGPLKSGDPNYKGSSYNVLIEWENGEITAEALNVIAADDPVTCAIYAKENGLLEVPGWRQFKSIAKKHKKFVRMVNQSKLRSYNSAPRFKYGFEIPRNYAHALILDERNKNTKWRDAVALELLQIQEYETFKSMGHKSSAKAPAGYKKIRVHLVFDVKHDGRHKARLVADGHLTEIPTEAVYSGVVSLRSFRLVAFAAELNDLLFWATDIGNAYLEAFTSEKVYIEAGPEFGELAGHILLISKALYGLRTSSAQWADRLADVMREIGFKQCKAEPYIWMRPNGDVYEYVAVYVDDLALAMKDPQSFVDQLVKQYNFKLKGTGPVAFHLGMDFSRDKDGTLCMSSKKYTEKIIANYERMYGESPKQNVSSPLEKGDHPEIDTSEFLDDKATQEYQSLIGSLQWLISIGRFDIMTAVMTMSAFRAAPRKGHLDRVKRIFGYVSKMRNAAIRFRTEEPDLSDLPVFEYDWSKSVYGEVKEVLPHDAPKALGKPVVSVHYVDANLMHCMATGKSVTGILHFLNKTPIDWYSKKQATVETATYGSEFVAARTCVEQIIDIRNTLRYMGIPIREKAFMFGDNESVVNSSTTVHAKLHKRHTMLSFHRVREAIASGMIAFLHIPGEMNPADILSKHWGYSQIWPRLKVVLFWMGDTSEVDE
jgi:hypothetical protein